MTVKTNEVKSSWITGVGYDNRDQSLTVQIGTKLYVYLNVPNDVAFEFACSESKGKVLNQKIKNKYECFQLTSAQI